MAAFLQVRGSKQLNSLVYVTTSGPTILKQGVSGKCYLFFSSLRLSWQQTSARAIRPEAVANAVDLKKVGAACMSLICGEGYSLTEIMAGNGKG
jgi:hypothetical protein